MLSIMISLHAYGAGLQCEQLWSGPSTDNDIAACLTRVSVERFSGPPYALAVICALFLVVSLLIFPIIFLCCVCCQCCCACCKEVPSGARSESKNSRKNLLILMVILLGIGVTVLALIITGATQLRSGAAAVFTNFQIGIVDFFDNLVTDLQGATYDNATGNYTEPFSNNTFHDIHDQIAKLRNTIDDHHSDVMSYSDLTANVGYGLAVFPIFLFSFTFLFASLSCRRCFPSLLTCLYYLIGIVFAVVGVVMFILAAVISDVCAEISLQQTRQPGLFQWYVVPVCENTANFTSYKEQINTMEADFAKQFCQELSKYCSPSTTFNAGAPADVFYCTTSNASAAADCPNFGNATAILNAAFAKTGSGVCGASNCTFRQCPAQCVDTQLRSNAADALEILDNANRIFNALDIVLPLMSCNAVVDIVLRLFDSCPDLRDGLMKTGVAFFLTLIGIVFAWIVMFRGQKVWFSQQEYDDDVKSLNVDCSSEELLGLHQQRELMLSDFPGTATPCSTAQPQVSYQGAVYGQQIYEEAPPHFAQQISWGSSNAASSQGAWGTGFAHSSLPPPPQQPKVLSSGCFTEGKLSLPVSLAINASAPHPEKSDADDKDDLL
jgi:hypothetical protein